MISRPHRELLRISGDEIVGVDFGLREVMHQVRQVAATDSPVLLTGEIGGAPRTAVVQPDMIGPL